MMSATQSREGSNLEVLLAEIAGEHAEPVHFLGVDRVRRGGVAGFFAKERIQVRYETGEASEPADAGLADLLEAADVGDGGGDGKRDRVRAVDVDADRRDPRSSSKAGRDGVNSEPTDDAFADVLLAIAAESAARATAAESMRHGKHSPPTFAGAQYPDARATVPMAPEASGGLRKVTLERAHAADHDIERAASEAVAAAGVQTAAAEAAVDAALAASVRPLETLSLLTPAAPVLSDAPVWSAAPVPRHAITVPDRPAHEQPGSEPLRMAEPMYTEQHLEKPRAKQPQHARTLEVPIRMHMAPVPAAPLLPAPLLPAPLVPASMLRPATVAEAFVMAAPIAVPVAAAVVAQIAVPAAAASVRSTAFSETTTLLTRLGVPADLIELVDRSDPTGALGQVVELLPATVSLPTTPGSVIVVAGRGHTAPAAARTLAAGLRVAVREMTDEKAARSAARELQLATTPTVVAVDVDAWSAAGRVAAIVTELEPAMVLAVVDAAAKSEDNCNLLQRLGRVDALLVTGVEETSSPASVWALGLPVVAINGRAATRGAWLGVLYDAAAT